ncbi:MAG TPA: hypothetical protein ENG09_07640 [Candidatus Syntrophoarchaeum butanivorans]|uniref:DUF5320 domain-containing protein n=2 Tax=Candidatus Syntropharchaeum butanivorans TaxID=1839936 RepID=A0A1F2P5K7_9EURY|nr:MAG: hypothetical protein SBU_000546 [Candidatus Syntrophoarchaeum butanivorans]RJS73626.1 MAG: hypothetical protein CW694_00215 [Candidatus Syntrophoarchaeum sp. WYZ-LMO15]HDM37090.1 hypothetical protein [Candidatus Syntrophoarchaeum butanivorans]
MAGYRWRNMYYMTGLPGWMRFGYSPGWGGVSPGVQVPPATHGACAYFVPPNRCSLKDKEVDPMSEACRDFRPRFGAFSAPFFGPGTFTEGQEIQMLEAEARMIEQRLAEIKKRLEELGK